MKTLDAIDRKILKQLSQNSQIPLSELSEVVSLSTTALHHRIRKLKEDKIIERFSIVLNPAAFGSHMLCFIKVLKFKKSSIDLAAKFKQVPEVEGCYSVTGEESLLLKVRVANTSELQQVLERLQKFDGVERMLTSLVIEEHFDRGFSLSGDKKI